MLRRMGWALFAVVAAYLFVLLFFFAVMKQSPSRFSYVISRVPRPLFRVLPFRRLWMNARNGRLSVGEAAPDFRLVSLDRKTEVQLSSFKGQKPVVLIFGSYT